MCCPVSQDPLYDLQHDYDLPEWGRPDSRLSQSSQSSRSRPRDSPLKVDNSQEEDENSYQQLEPPTQDSYESLDPDVKDSYHQLEPPAQYIDPETPTKTRGKTSPVIWHQQCLFLQQPSMIRMEGEIVRFVAQQPQQLVAGRDKHVVTTSRSSPGHHTPSPKHVSEDPDKQLGVKHVPQLTNDQERHQTAAHDPRLKASLQERQPAGCYEVQLTGGLERRLTGGRGVDAFNLSRLQEMESSDSSGDSAYQVKGFIPAVVIQLIR